MKTVEDLLGSSLAVLLFFSILSHSAVAQDVTPKREPSKSLLDDLLTPSLPESGSKTDRASELPSDSTVEADKKSVAENLSRIIADMESAAKSLQASKPGSVRGIAKALESQSLAIQELDQLLKASLSSASANSSTASSSEEAKAEAMRLGYGKSQETQATTSDTGQDNAAKDPSPDNDPQKSDDSSEMNTEESKTGDSQQKSDAGEQDQPNSNAGEVASGLPTKATIVELMDSFKTSGKANWGKLPERLRDQMSSQGAIQFPPGYESRIREYYKQLNESILELR